MSYPKLHIAIPLMNEMEMIQDIIKSIDSQLYSDYIVYVCVNQPDKWWTIYEKTEVCNNNQKTIDYLKALLKENYVIIDRSAKGSGWKDAEGGAGWARKVIMDQIALTAKDDDLIVSLDGDTLFNEGYFGSICKRFSKNNKSFAALSNPYYHRLTGNEIIDRALLRYEIYLRYYLINMFRIKSPYAFTALGSAIVVPVWAYKAVSGITPVKNGEDFYFLQKLAKYRKIMNWNCENVYPSGRLSDRVDFGTGPALISGIEGNWKSYPIFDHRLFDEVKVTFDLFPELYQHDVSTPMSDFLKNQFKSDDIWLPLRKNYNDVSRFIHACECKVDGLRIFQYLRSTFDYNTGTDEIRLISFLNTFYGHDIEKAAINLNRLSFVKNSIQDLNKLRNFLEQIEFKLRYEHDGRK
jgi:hypothetical protein